MKTIYVVTSQYMPLIVQESFNRPSRDYTTKIVMDILQKKRTAPKTIYAGRITRELIREILDVSKSKMLAFKTKEEAVNAMALALKPHNVLPDLIDGDIPFFAVPLIFTVQVNDDFSFEKRMKLTGAKLHRYFETNSIPNFTPYLEQGFWKDSVIKHMDDKLKLFDSCPKFFNIDKADVAPHLLNAFYLAADPLREVIVPFVAAEEAEKIIQEGAAPINSFAP